MSTHGSSMTLDKFIRNMQNNPSYADAEREYQATPKRLTDAVNSFTKPANRAIDFMQSSGQQAAASAGREYTNRAIQSGGSTLGAGAVKAQSLLPFLAEATGKRADVASQVAQMKIQSAGMLSDIAQALGGLKLNYANSLAAAIGQRDQFSLAQSGQKSEDLRLQLAALQTAKATPTESANWVEGGYAQGLSNSLSQEASMKAAEQARLTQAKIMAQILKLGGIK